MRIKFTLDDVMRDKMKSFVKEYNHYNETVKNGVEKIDEESFVATSADLHEMFKFKTKKEFNDFLYSNYAFEIFGAAETKELALDKKFNNWLLEVQDAFDEADRKVDFSWVSMNENNQSIGATYFYLSKIATRIRKAIFPVDTADVWKDCDVLVTADPSLLKDKPDGVVTVRIETEYNKNVMGNFSYPSLSALIDDKEFIKKLVAY